MNAREKSLARIIFQNKILKKDGQEFENFFVSIMSYAYADFKPIKPQGTIGDRKNDGYIPSIGAYYQVYSPEKPSKNSSISKAIQKAKEDFDGLYQYWSQISDPEEYYFVINDKYKGSYPEVEKVMSEIKGKYMLNKSEVFLAKNLEDVCFSLLEDSQLNIAIGFIPPVDEIKLIDFHTLSEIIGYIIKYLQPIDVVNWIPPEFDGKITYNNLGDLTRSVLNNAYHQCGILEDYFDNSSDFTRQEVRDRISKAYADAMNEFDNIDIEQKSDHVFMRIVESLTPSNVKDNLRKQIQDAVFVLMAYYFSSCDIFESPIKENK